MSRFVRNNNWRKLLRRLPWLERGGQRLEDGLLLGLWWLCGQLSPAVASRLGTAVMRVVGPLTTKHEKIATNLAIAFPEKSSDELEAIARAIWRSIGANAGEYPHLATLGERAIGDGIGVVTDIPPHLEANFRGERLTVFISGHLANWEILAAVPRIWGTELAVVYTPIGDGTADRWLRAYRERMGSLLLPRDGSARALLRHLKSGQPIGIVADHREDEGEALPFFGHTKLTTLSPARLALKSGADLVPARVERLGPARFKISAYGQITPPATAGSDTEKAIAMMAEFNRVLEGWIRERPEEWICGKRAFAKELVKALRPAASAPQPAPSEAPHAQ